MDRLRRLRGVMPTGGPLLALGLMEERRGDVVAEWWTHHGVETTAEGEGGGSESAVRGNGEGMDVDGCTHLDGSMISYLYSSRLVLFHLFSVSRINCHRSESFLLLDAPLCALSETTSSFLRMDKAIMG